jgi:hypothetical protein
MTDDVDLDQALADEALEYLRAAKRHRHSAGQAQTGRDAQSHMIASAIALDKAKLLAEKYGAKLRKTTPREHLPSRAQVEEQVRREREELAKGE